MRAVLSISLPEEMAKELNEFARDMGRNKSDIVKESISLFLWEARFNKTRKTLSLKAKSQGIITDDDLFRAVS